MMSILESPEILSFGISLMKRVTFITCVIFFKAWDMGYGFKMPDLYKTGWTVLGTSVVAGVLLAML